MKSICNITKPSITRLARLAGVKIVSEECYDVIRQIIVNRITELIDTSLIVNSEHQTKTLMSGDIYNAFNISGENITHFTDLGMSTCSK